MINPATHRPRRTQAEKPRIPRKARGKLALSNHPGNDKLSRDLFCNGIGLETVTSLRHVPIIRLFVSSTFSDLKQERDALQTGVFRKLEILCREYGFQFEAIDLRWGISEETGLNHRVMRICLEELTRSQQVSPQPNFLILLGNRYGWRPLPEAISSTEYGLLAAAATALAADKQARIAGVHGKTAKQVLDDWYRLDENALVPPTVPLQPIDPAPDCEVLNYLLQPRTQDLNDGRDYTRTAEEYPVDTPEWDAVQDVLWRIINEVFAGDAPAVANRFADRFRSIDWKQRMAAIHRPQRPMRSVPQAVRFQGSATEQEIWCGALSGADSGEHVLAFFREIDPHQELEDARLHREYFDGQPAGLGSSIPREVPALSALKQALRDRLGPRAVDLQSKAKLIRAIDAHGRQTAVVSTEHLGQLCDEAYSRLEQCILAEIARYRMPSAAPPQEQSRSGVGGRGMTVERELEIERQTHRRFAQERGSVNDFVGRQLQRRQIEEYLGNDSRAPFVVSGASGSGKSALLARVFHDVDSQAGSRSILRFIGATRDSSDLRSLLTSLCQELGLNETPAGARSLEIRELLNTFILQLVEVSGQQQVVLFLDALDQLADADGALRLFWIPRTLPRHVKFVVSCLSDRDAADPAGQPYAELTEWSLPPENFQRLEPLEPEEARGLLFDKWLPGAGRTIPAGSRQYAMIEKHLKLNAITADVDEAPYRQPLYLRLVFEEVRLWASYDSSAFLPEPDPSRTYIETLLEHSFQRLEREANHGRLLVARALG